MASRVERLVDLSGLDEHAVVQTADLAEHEVAGSGVLRDLDELGGVPEAPGLGRGHEGHVGLSEPGDILRRQGQHRILHQRRCVVVGAGELRW